MSSKLKKDDKFKYHSDEYTEEEIKAAEKHDFDPKFIESIQDEKDKKFLEAMERDDAADYVAETEQEKAKKAFELKEEAANFVETGHKGYSSYVQNLAQWGVEVLSWKGVPMGYECHCVPSMPGSMNIYGRTFDTQYGVIFVLKDPKGRVYMKAVRASMDTWVDVNAIQLLAVEVENTIDYLEGELEDMDSGKIVDKAVKELYDSKGNLI